MKRTLKRLAVATLAVLTFAAPAARAQWTSQFNVIYLPGNFNGYDTSGSAMRLVSNGVWQAYVALTNFPAPQFLFSNYQFDNPPSSNAFVWKETNQPAGNLPFSGNAELNAGNDIAINGTNSGYLRITFDDVTRAYRVENATFGTPPAEPWINEFHYDNVGTDTNEGIEVAGPAGRSLIGYSLVLYNGANGQSYQVTSLSGTLTDQGGGIGTRFFSYASAGGLQNGAPDGIALVKGSTVLQFLSYMGSFTAVNGAASGLTSVDIGLEEGGGTPADYSLQLAGVGGTYSNFFWTGPALHSRGQINANQLPLGGPVAASVAVSNLTTTPVVPMTGQTVTISAYITPTNGASNITATAFYRVGSVGAYRPLAMTNAGTLYTTVSNIPPQAPGSLVRYYLFVNFSGPGTNSPTLVPSDAPATTRTTGFSAIPYGTVWINEVDPLNYLFAFEDYEFVELAGIAGASLKGWVVELADTQGVAYASYTFTNNAVLGNEFGGFGFYVWGDPLVPFLDEPFAHPSGFEGHLNNAGIVRLYDAFGLLWDSIAYNVTNPAIRYAGFDPSDAEFVDASLALTGTGSNSASLAWGTNYTLTSGAVNDGQTLVGGNTNPILPLILCPADLFLPCTNSAIPAASITNVVSTGFCGSGSVTVTWAGDVTNAGTGCRGNPKIVTRTYKSFSACASTNTCTQFIILEDTNAPSLTTPDDSLANRGFENGSLIGWSLTGAVNTFSANVADPRQGTFHAVLAQPARLFAEDNGGFGLDGTYYGGLTRAQLPATTNQLYSVRFDGTNGYIEIPPVNVQGQNMTIATWLRRNGTQATSAGIVFSRAANTVAGLHFTTNNNLGYTWNGATNTYQWESGIAVPDTQWCFVAMSVDSTQTLLYCRTTSTWFIATNRVTHAAEEFDGATSIGRDPTGTRYFKGWLDDVQLYNVTLSRAQITNLWNSARGDLTELGLLARYRLDDNPTASQQGSLYQDLAAGSNQFWTAGVWAKNDPSNPLAGTNDVQVALQFLNATNGILTNIVSATRVTVATATSVYNRILARGTSPAQTVKARLKITYQQDAAVSSGSVLIDDTILSPLFVTAGSGINQCGVMPNYLTNAAIVSASDGCGGPLTLTQSPLPGATFSNANQLVTITAADPCGNLAVATFNIYVDDTTPPLTFNVSPASVVQACPAPVTSSFVAFDNCSAGLLVTLESSYTNIALGCSFDPRITTNIYRLTDMGGNVRFATQTIRVTDTNRPVATVTLPTLTNAGFEAASLAGWNSFGTYALVQTGVTRSGEYRLRLNGDTNTPANYTGIYQDLEPAAAGDVWRLSAWVQVPTNETLGSGNKLEAKIECLDSNGSFTGTFLAPLVTGTFERGLYRQVYVTATAPTNTARVRATLVYVQTNAQPGAVLVDDVALSRTMFSGTNVCGVDIPSLVNLADSTDCNPVEYSQVPLAGTYLPVGTNPVALVVKDLCDNFTTSIVNVLVVDVAPPLILSAPSNITVTSSNAIPAPNPALVVSTDLCSVVTNTFAGDSFNGGAGTSNNPLVVVRRYLATDAWGNSSQTQQIITVIGATPEAPTNVQFKAISIGTNIVVRTLGTNTWSVRVEYATNLVGTPNWWIITNYNNTYANGTNTTSFPLPTNSPPAFFRFFQTYP